MTGPAEPTHLSLPSRPHVPPAQPGLRLALIHDWLTGMRGGEKCLEVLCRRYPDARLFTMLRAEGATSPTIERMSITTSCLQWLPGITQYYRWLLPLMPAAVQRLTIPRDVDLVVSFSHAVAKAVQAPPGVPHVCYCFTPMRYAWQRRGDYLPSGSTLAQKTVAMAGGLFLDWIRDWDRQTCDRVTHFVAVSRTVAQRIHENYGRRSRVIYPPVNTQFFTPAGLRREDYYLCISALVPYKRIELAIEACNRLRRRLVVIGEGPEHRRLARLAGPTVMLSGWLSNEQIRDQLRRCRALVFPGHEDFGIVPVEAQACGTPVIALGQGGSTETVLPAEEGRPGTGLFFDEPTVDALCEAIERFEAHPDWFSPQLARQQAEQFTAQRFEQELVSFLEEVAGIASACRAAVPTPEWASSPGT